MIPRRACSVGDEPAAGEESADARVFRRARANFGFWFHINARNRSSVIDELALRPEFSAQVRMPPTVLPAPRGVWRGLLVLTAGLVPYFYRRYPTGRWSRPYLIERSGVLALFLPRGANRGTGRPNNHDADRTELGSAQARRVQSRSRIAAALAGSRCATPSEHPASGRPPDQGTPGRSERSPPRVPDAIVRLAGAVDAAFEMSGVQDALTRHGKRRRSDRGSVCGSLLEPVGDLGEIVGYRVIETRGSTSHSDARSVSPRFQAAGSRAPGTGDEAVRRRRRVPITAAPPRRLRGLRAFGDARDRR